MEALNAILFLLLIAAFFAAWIAPVILGVKWAKRNGVSPHWMWFGVHPVGGWIAYPIIRWGNGISKVGDTAVKWVTGKVACPSCGKFNPMNNAFCAQCGIPTLRPACPHCKADKTRFVGRVGQYIGGAIALMVIGSLMINASQSIQTTRAVITYQDSLVVLLTTPFFIASLVLFFRPLSRRTKRIKCSSCGAESLVSEVTVFRHQAAQPLAATPQERVVEEPTPKPQPQPQSGLVEKLERLAALHQRGELTDSQYEAAKRELLPGEEPQVQVPAKGESRQAASWSDTLCQYQDGDDQRAWTILEPYDHKTAYREFPDYDVAYARASGILESGGVPGNWNSAILKEGLSKSRVKSRLLFHLSANSLFQGKGEEALVQAVQGFHASDQVPSGAGPHVYAFFLLYYLFEAQEGRGDQTPVRNLVAMNNPGMQITSSQNTRIKEVSQETAGRLDKALLSAAEEVIRSRLKVRLQKGPFPAWY
jgi:hypothetical protein